LAFATEGIQGTVPGSASRVVLIHKAEQTSRQKASVVARLPHITGQERNKIFAASATISKYGDCACRHLFRQLAFDCGQDSAAPIRAFPARRASAIASS
jgi:hypothetical protein